MKIGLGNQGNIGQTQNTSQSARVGTTPGSTQGLNSQQFGLDRVDVSSVAQTASSVIGITSDQRAQQVAKLTQQYQSGQYNVDAVQLSQAIVTQDTADPAMRTEVDVEAPRSVAEQRTYEWLDRVEASVEKAHAALLLPQRNDVPEFSSEMESAWRERSGLTATPEMALRLRTLRERLLLLRSLLRQASAFVEAREQLETEHILGYTPRGLELAL